MKNEGALLLFENMFFFHDTPYFFSRPAWTDIDINIALNFCGKKDDSPLWVRRRLNIFMNYSLKILFATNCKACDLANCLWLLIKDSFRASKIKLDANVTYNHCQLWQVKVPKNYRVVKKRQTFYYLIIFKLRLKSPRLGIYMYGSILEKGEINNGDVKRPFSRYPRCFSIQNSWSVSRSAAW